MLESFERNDVFYLNAQPDHIGQFYRWFGDIMCVLSPCPSSFLSSEKSSKEWFPDFSSLSACLVSTHVWAEDGELVSCLSDPSCVASNENPTGM